MGEEPNLDKIAAAFQDGFTNGNAIWDETPEYHKDMFREGARCALAALSGMAEPVAWRRMNEQRTQSTGVTDTEYYRDLWTREGSIVEPLYATPPASGLREELQNALYAMRHVFMTLPVPSASDQKRAWGSLVDAIQAADAALSEGK